ncbi:MAG: VWA domain-containing protein [Anaerolineales bacterium]|nr:VWA domain-containing protein [Anaerolineales bacterium]
MLASISASARKSGVLRFALAVTVFVGLAIASTGNLIAQTEPVSPPAPERIAPDTSSDSQSASPIDYVAPSATDVQLCQIDLVFVADGSGSISSADFLQIKQFIRTFIGNINVGAQGTKAALVQFSSEGDGRVEQTLTDNATTINAAINNMVQLNGNTDIQEGIQLAAAELQARGRPNTPRVIVLLTDGEHNQPGDPVLESTNFKQAGGYVFTIAVGSAVNRNELIRISSQPYTRYLYDVTDANSLSAILNSLSENVCSCAESESNHERVTRVADGLCLRVIDDTIYIGAANLANADVRLKLAYEFDDLSQGLFTKRSLKEHVFSDADLTSLTCLPSLAFPFTPGLVCISTPTQYYFAINGNAHASQFSNPDRPSHDSILAIGGQLYTDTGVGAPEKPRASFFTFSGLVGAIHRAYTTTAAPAPSYQIPAAADAPSSEYAQARTYVAQQTAAKPFAVGYNLSILDTTATPPLLGNVSFADQNEELTAIGISSDGKTVYLAAAKTGVGPQVLAQKLAALGAVRAILLDGNSSTQFASFRENFSAFYPFSIPSFVRPILNGVVAYSTASNAEASITIAGTADPLVLAPNTTVDLAGSGLAAGTVLTQRPILLGGPGTINATTPFSVPQATAPLMDSGIAYVTYAQNPSGQVIQPQASYGLIANYDLVDFSAGTYPCMLGIYFWDGVQWKREPTSRVNPQQRAIVAQPAQFGVWAILTDPAATCAYLPMIQQSPPPTPTATPVPPTMISIATNSQNSYQLQSSDAGEGLSAGKRVYTDRSYQYQNVPSLLQGRSYILTSNNDSVKYDLVLTVTVNKPIKLYVAHTDRQTPKPSWLNTFQDTGENLTFVDRSGNTVVLSVFSASFPAGTVTLGANTPPNGEDHSMYTVALEVLETTTSANTNLSN